MAKPSHFLQRTHMMRLLLIVGMLGGIACGAPADPIAVATRELEAWQARICGCPDAACVQRTDPPYRAWRDALRLTLKGKRATAAQEVRYRELRQAIQACRARYL